MKRIILLAFLPSFCGVSAIAGSWSIYYPFGREDLHKCFWQSQWKGDLVSDLDLRLTSDIPYVPMPGTNREFRSVRDPISKNLFLEIYEERIIEIDQAISELQLRLVKQTKNGPVVLKNYTYLLDPSVSYVFEGDVGNFINISKKLFCKKKFVIRSQSNKIYAEWN